MESARSVFFNCFSNQGNVWHRWTPKMHAFTFLPFQLSNSFYDFHFVALLFRPRRVHALLCTKCLHKSTGSKIPGHSCHRLPGGPAVKIPLLFYNIQKERLFCLGPVARFSGQPEIPGLASAKRFMSSW